MNLETTADDKETTTGAWENETNGDEEDGGGMKEGHEITDEADEE